MGAPGLDQRAREEVEVRHAFFVDWFTGRADAAAFDTAMTSFDPAFFHIGPDGGVKHLAALRGMLAAAKGRFGADFGIGIEVEETTPVAPACILVRYVERQFHDGNVNARRATALFRHAPGAVSGVAWLYVQETWIKPPAPE